jgi:D-3-phosphoglycerate dehydrogenase
VDDTALIRALQEGKIAGAGLDVTADECIAADNPLLQMSNVILTGRSVAYSEEAYAEIWSKPMTQVIAAMKGEFPQYAVNRDVKKKRLDKWVHGEEERGRLQPVLSAAPVAIRTRVA